MNATDKLTWGVVMHLIADWLLQNQWMSDNKSDPQHPAGYVHASIHFAALSLVFTPLVALALAVLHFIVDLRSILKWWRRTFRQTTEGPAALHVAIWEDQVVHIALIALAALLSRKRL